MEVKEYTYGQASIFVYRPKLSDKELDIRQNVIKTALQQIGKEIQNGNSNQSRNFREK